MDSVSLGKIVFVVAVAAGVTLGLACGTSHPPIGTIGNNADDPTACATEGAVQACHITMGMQNGVTNCIAGTQTCSAGHWLPCTTKGGVAGAHYGGTFTSNGFNPYSSTGLPNQKSTGLRLLNDPIPPTTDAGLCQDDPCDPYCWGWDDEAASVPPPPPLPPANGGNPSGLPPGWYTGATVQPTCNVPGNPQDCNFDQCCPATGSACTSWTTAIANADGGALTGTCAPSGGCATGPDFTVEVGCNDPVTNDTIIPVCNRGGTTANTGSLIVALQDDSGGPPGPSHFPFVAGHGHCNIDLTMIPLVPNSCVNVDVNKPQAGIQCFSIKVEKYNTLFVNGGGGNGSASSAAQLALAECNGANNWGAINNQKCAAPTGAGGGPLFTCAPVATLPFGEAINQAFTCHPGNPSKPASLGQCLYDSCCYKNGFGDCRDWDSVQSGDCDLTNNGCTGQVNYTASAGCTDAVGDVHVQICNRGDTAVSSGTFNVGFAAGDSFGQAPRNYPFKSIGGCTWNWATVGGLGSDGCQDLNVTKQTLDGTPVDCSTMTGGPAAFLATNGGRHTIRVNTTDTGDSSNQIVSTGDGNNGLPECTGADDWSGYESGVACTACAQIGVGTGGGDYPYTAVCPSGYHVKWKYLAYNVTGGEVEFAATTTSTLIDGSTAPVSTSYTVADPPNAPVATSCQYGGGGGCPVDLAAILGPVDSMGEKMILSINTKAGASALGWSVSYDCLPYE